MYNKLQQVYYNVTMCSTIGTFRLGDDRQLGNGPYPKVPQKKLSFREALQEQVNWWLQGVLDI